MKSLSLLRGFVVAFMALALLAVFGSIGSADPPRTVNEILAFERSTCTNCNSPAAVRVENSAAIEYLGQPMTRSAECGCGASCGCAAEASAVVTRFERVRLFPRARGFVSTVAERSPKPLRRLVMTVMSRYRR